MTDFFDFQMDAQALRSLSGPALAHVGDAVYELLVRTWLCERGASTNHRLHTQAVSRVCAPAQADFIGRILPLLTEEETAVYKRGRNASTHAAPKSATPGQYARATGLEALFGWLWLRGQKARLSALFAAGMEDADAV